MIEISALNVYPLKGGRGVSLSEVAIGQFGPRDDRRWMVVDANGTFVSQREVARLCQVVATVDDSGLRLSAPYAPTTSIERPSETEPRRPVRVWNDQVDAIDAGDPAAAWFTAFLSIPSRLVYIPDTTYRRTDPGYDPIGSAVSFADGYPILLVGERSLEDLNTRLAAPLPMNRFRPNVVVTGIEPFEEDRWREFEIGGIQFDAVKPCARCMVTTTDQETGERSHEPLKTLATFRKRGSGVMFGVNVVHRGMGVIRVGDPVTVRAKGA